MKNGKRKLILSLYLGMILLAVSGLSVSLAWFVSSAQLQVQAVKVELKTDRSLKVSLTGESDTFEEDIGISQLKDSGLFTPVTSMYSRENFLSSKGSSPVFLSSYGQITPTSGVPHTPSKATGGYFTQEFYLLSDDDIYVTLDSEKTSFTSDHENNLKVALEKDGNDKEKAESDANKMDSLIKALRLSILVPSEEDYSYTVLDPYKNGDTLFGGRLDLNRSGFYNYYVDKNGEKYETIYGDVENREKAVYSTSTSGVSINGTLSSFNSGTKEGVHAYDEEASFANGVTYAKEGALSLKEYEEDSSKWISLTRNTPKKIVLSIYLEGWDRDCINETMGASFLSKLSLKIARER